MRELKRSIMRAAAIKQGIKPSKYINSCWHRYQQLRYGEKIGWVHRLTDKIRAKRTRNARKNRQERNARKAAIKRARRKD